MDNATRVYYYDKWNEPFANAGEQRNFQFWLTDLPVCMGLDLGLGVSHRNCAVRSSLQKAQYTICAVHCS